MAGKVLLANGTVIDVRAFDYIGLGLEVWVHRDQTWEHPSGSRTTVRHVACDLVLGPGGWLAAWKV